MATESLIIWQKFPFRIRETRDFDTTADDLKGDCYHYEKSGYTGTREELRAEERDFEAEVELEGVYGYTLELWNPFADARKKWTHVDSCCGFVGQYVPKRGHKYNHYIVKELKDTAAAMRKGKAS